MSSPPGSQHGPTPAVCPPAATLHTIAGGRPTPSTHFSPQVLAGTPVRDVRRSCHEVPFDQVKPPHFTAQYRVPPQWLTAARDRGEVPAMFATRPWPHGGAGSAGRRGAAAFLRRGRAGRHDLRPLSSAAALPGLIRPARPVRCPPPPLSDGRRRFHRTTQISWTQREFGPARSLTE